MLPGLHTPDVNLVQKCIESYAEESPEESGLWTLRHQESIPMRKEDIKQVGNLVKQLGTLLKYESKRYEDYPYSLIIDDQILEPEIYIWEEIYLFQRTIA